MQETICTRCVKKGLPVWLPLLVDEYRSLLIGKNVSSGESKKFYALASNVSYELQYLEFLSFVIENTKITESIKRQNIKTFIITVSNIIEGILYYELEGQFAGKEIRFSQLLHEAQRIDLLGTRDSFYDQLWELKDLRNKAHIQISTDSSESDYNSFTDQSLTLAKAMLSIFMKKFYRMDENEFQKFCYFLIIEKFA